MKTVMLVLLIATSPAIAMARGHHARYHQSYGHELSLEDYNNATDIALRAVDIVDELGEGTNYRDLGRYLLPIKRAAATVYAIGQARGDSSLRTINALAALEAAIDRPQDYLESSFTVPGQFELATELLSLREEIDAIID